LVYLLVIWCILCRFCRSVVARKIWQPCRSPCHYHSRSIQNKIRAESQCDQMSLWKKWPKM
jgi:hypothetical protein